MSKKISFYCFACLWAAMFATPQTLVLLPASAKTQDCDGLPHTQSGLTETRTIDAGKTLANADNEVKKNPKSPLAYINRARTYQLIGDYQKAIADYTQAIKLNSASNGPRFTYQMRGLCFVKMKDYNSAISDFTQAIAQDPTNGSALYNRAVAYEKLGKKALAQADREELKKMHFSPDSNMGMRYARYLMHNGQYREALEVFDRKIKENPDRPFSYFGHAQCLYKLKEYEKALADLNKIEKLKSGFSGSGTLKATIYLDCGNFDACIRACKQALSQNPSNIDILTILAKAHKAVGSYAEAEQDFNKAIALQPENPELYRERAQLYEKTGNPKKSLKDYDKLVSLLKKDTSALVSRALVMRQLNKNEDAIEDLTKAIKLSPKDESLYAKRAEIFYAQHNLSKALSDYSQAIQLDPGNKKYYMGYYKKIKTELSEKLPEKHSE